MNKALRATCSILAALVLGGCAVGPDYKAPRPDLPSSWPKAAVARNSVSKTSQEPSKDLARWWVSFEDPTLTRLIEEAISNNLNLKQAEMRILQARASREVAAADFFPQVDLGSRYERSRSGGRATSSSFGSGSSSSQRDLFQAGLDATWELDFFGGIRRSIEAAQADFQASVEDRRDILVTLVSEVAVNYANYRGYQRQLEIARNTLAAQERVAGVTQKRFEAGFIGSLDVANAQAQTASTRAQIPALETLERQTAHNLAVLLGQEPTALLGELSTAQPIPAMPPSIPLGLPADLLKRRPDVRRSEARLHAATARIGVATADLFPKISLTGSFGLQGRKASALTDLANQYWGFGPNLNWPIFDAGRIRANVRLQKAAAEETLLLYRQTILTALQDVDNGLVAFEKEQDRRIALAQGVEANRKAVDVSTRLYQEGKTDFLNVLTSQRSLYTAEDALAQSDRTLFTNAVALYKALGGGWDELPSPVSPPRFRASDAAVNAR